MTSFLLIAHDISYDLRFILKYIQKYNIGNVITFLFFPIYKVLFTNCYKIPFSYFAIFNFLPRLYS